MKKAVKKKRRIGIWIGIVCIAAAVALVLSVKINTVTVTGNSRYTTEEIDELLFQGKWSRNSVSCYFKNRFMDHEIIPFVEDYKIIFNSPTEVEVMVYEKSVVGFVTYMGSNMYFDKDGIIVESTNESLEGVPWITGLRFGNIILHESLPVENPKIFENILNLTQLLSVYKIGVDKIQYSSNQTAVLFMDEVEVKLGDSSNIDGKISTLNDIITSVPEFLEKSGILYLDSYDETNDRTAYTFETN